MQNIATHDANGDASSTTVLSNSGVKYIRRWLADNCRFSQCVSAVVTCDLQVLGHHHVNIPHTLCITVVTRHVPVLEAVRSYPVHQGEHRAQQRSGENCSHGAINAACHPLLRSMSERDDLRTRLDVLHVQLWREKVRWRHVCGSWKCACPSTAACAVWRVAYTSSILQR